MSIANGSPGIAADPLVSLTSAGVAYHAQHGNDADKSTTPLPGWVYIAEDTHLLYACYVSGVWSAIGSTYAEDMTQVDCKATGPTVAFSFTLAANDLGADGDLVLECFGTWSNSTGGNRTPTVTFNFGVSTITLALAAYASGSSGRFRLSLWVSNTASNTQKYFARAWFTNATNNHNSRESQGTLAVNTAIDTTVSADIAWSAGTTTCLKQMALSHLFL